MTANTGSAPPDDTAYTETLARYVSTVRFADLPDDVVVHAKRITLNLVAASLWGWVSAGGTQVHRVLAALGGPPEVTVFGMSDRMPIPHAAALHAALAFASKSDDTHGPAQVHIGHAVVPVALAVGERAGISGREFLATVVAAIEAGVRVADAVGPGQDLAHNSMRMGFWSEVKCGIASALAAGRLGGLSVEQLCHAVGIAATSSSGLLSSAGYGPAPHRAPAGSVFAWDAGKAVLLGTLAARLAAAGMTTGARPLEAERGWVRVYAGGYGRLRSLTEGLGETYHTRSVALKTHCMSHTVFPVVEIAGELVAAEGIAVDDIAEVIVHGPAYVVDNFWRTTIDTFEDAVCSAPFAIALNMVAPARMTFPDKVVGHLGDPVVADLIRRFSFALDESIPMNSGQLPGAVTIRTRDGRTFGAPSRPAALGSYPEFPLREEEIAQKFRAAASRLLPDSTVEDAVAMFADLESLPDIGRLTRTLRPTRQVGS